MITAKAPGKIILFGEHAVVYGKPGIAVPVRNVYTLATVIAEPFSYTTDKELNDEDKIKINKLFKLIFDRLELHKKNISVDIESNIPFSSGMGSSASLSIAIIRALSNYLDLKLSNEQINELSFECEKLFHGNPSGIDTAVITYEKPILFQTGKIQFITLKKPISFVIANTGIKSPTKDTIEEVRKNYDEHKEKYSRIFNEIGVISINAKKLLEEHNIKELGKLITKNHELLTELGVSSKELDALVENSITSGAYGAKLVGSGKGGNIIALVDEKNKQKVFNSLKEAGARDVISTVIL